MAGYVPPDYLPPGYLPDGYIPEAAAAADELEFVGPDISTIVLVEDVAMVARNFAARWTSPDAITYTLNGTPPAGVSLSSAGVLSGTPSVAGTFPGLSITADDGTDTVDSNVFTISVFAAGSISPGVSDGFVSDGFVSDGFVSGGGVSS